eukprot:107615-Pyramimonas_sp.AAC.1
MTRMLLQTALYVQKPWYDPTLLQRTKPLRGLSLRHERERERETTICPSVLSSCRTCSQGIVCFMRWMACKRAQPLAHGATQ